MAEEMTVKEAGRRGGTATSDAHGPEFYRKNGHKGGSRVLEVHGTEFFSEIGKKGGDAALAKHGPDFYRRIGKLGGHPKHKKNVDKPPGQASDEAFLIGIVETERSN